MEGELVPVEASGDPFHDLAVDDAALGIQHPIDGADIKQVRGVQR